MYSSRPFSELIKNKINAELVFIHTPKCAGSYVSSILSYLKIKNKELMIYLQFKAALPETIYTYRNYSTFCVYKYGDSTSYSLNVRI